MNHHTLHAKAKKMAKQYRHSEQELVAVIAQVDKSKLFYKLGYNSLFSYMTQSLGLSEAITCNISAVVGKSYEVPQLKNKVISGEISLSKARKLTPVITPENHEQWIELAQVNTQKQIERAVSLANPKGAIVEKTQYVSLGDPVKEKVQIKRNIPRLKLELGLSEKLMLKLRRCQDLESQKQKQNVDLENCLEVLVHFYLDKKDPLKKAQRQKAKGNLQQPREITQRQTTQVKLHSPIEKEKVNGCENDTQASVSDRLFRQISISSSPHPNAKLISEASKKRSSIPAKIKHQVFLRDEGQCTYTDHKGQRCCSKRYIEIHHEKPVSQGGHNSLENLRLLCSGHHKSHHLINDSR